MPVQRSVPEWLASACNNEYLGRVLRVLSDRETKREIARNASRLQLEKPHQAMPQGLARVYTTHYAVTIGASGCNKIRNRYLQLEPYDRTRVTVPAAGLRLGRYLNASWVLEKYGGKWWIASQAPLPQTAHTFLSLILQPITCPPPSLLPASPPYPSPQTTRIRTVIQLTKNVEDGRRKAHAYFPSDVGKYVVVPADEETHSPALKVTLLNVEEIPDAHCVKSTISVVPVIKPPSRDIQTDDYMEIEEDADKEGIHGEQRYAKVVFTHLLYTSWPDHGVPEAEDRISLLKFLHIADGINRDTSDPPERNVTDANLDPDPPIIVGCSAGVGRTGSFIALSSLLRHLGGLPPPAVPTSSSVIPPSPLGPLPDQFLDDLVAQEIDSLREQRQRMLERPEQVLLMYQILVNFSGES